MIGLTGDHSTLAKTQYHYDPETGALLGHSLLTRSPSGEILLDNNATTKVPMVSTVGFKPAFIEGEWTLIEDYRGKTIYSTDSGLSGVVTTVGAIPAGYTFNAPRAGEVWGGAQWVTDPDKVLAAARTKLIRKLNQDVDAALAAIISAYPATEILSWGKQELQAATYLAWVSSSTGPEPVCPTVDAIAAERGITKTLLCTKIVTKAAAFEVQSATLFGLRQKLEDQVEVLTLDEVNEFTYTLGD